MIPAADNNNYHCCCCYYYSYCYDYDCDYGLRLVPCAKFGRLQDSRLAVAVSIRAHPAAAGGLESISTRTLEYSILWYIIINTAILPV